MEISAVFPSLIVAEQYLSWLMAIARSTALAAMPQPVTVKCMCLCSDQRTYRAVIEGDEVVIRDDFQLTVG